MAVERLKDWEIIADSVRGPTHVRTGLPNQDHFKHDEGSSITIAVSDGHGSSKCFRSDKGARFAAEKAIEVTKSFFEGEWDRLSAEDQKHELSIRLPIRIVSEWQAEVRRDLEDFPLSKEEVELLESRSKGSWNSNSTESQFVAYGATLLTVVFKPEFVVYLQLGDGDILTALESGDVIRYLPPDERLIGNETTSLSNATAASDFRVRLVPLTTARPRLILLATDGYSNSFKDDTSFQQAASDFRKLLDSNGGRAEVEQHLKEWLEESAHMSGDDVTTCLLYKTAEAHQLKTHILNESQAPASIEPSDVGETCASIANMSEDNQSVATNSTSPEGESA